jgi:hypothetical protein
MYVHFWLLFSRKSYALILTKNGLGHLHFGQTFFTNSSGHPVAIALSFGTYNSAKMYVAAIMFAIESNFFAKKYG